MLQYSCFLERKWFLFSFQKTRGWIVDGKWLFEVGGAKKRFSQIKDIPDSFVAADDIEVGFGNKIPLWLFGFLY